MKLFFQLMIFFSLFFLGKNLAVASSRWEEARSESGLLIAQTHDNQLSASLLGVLEGVQTQIQDTYGFAPSEKTRLVVRVENWDSQATKTSPTLISWRVGPILNLQVTVFRCPQEGGEELFRHVITAMLYQAIYKDGTKGVSGDHLVELPLWLVEGLLQSLLDGQPEINLRIVNRARLIGKTPKLAVIMGWKALGTETLERTWQKAYCYQALQFAFSDERRWSQAKDWLAGRAQGTTDTEVPWVIDEAKEIQWTQFQVQMDAKSGPLLFSWSRTEAEIAAKQFVMLPASKDRPSTLVPLKQLMSFRDYPGFPVAVTNKISEFMALELRAHFSWRPVIERYRFALMSLLIRDNDGGSVDGKKGAQAPSTVVSHVIRQQDYVKQLEECKKMAANLKGFRTRSDDYLNWFEVTKQAPDKDSAFEGFFRLNDQLDSESSPVMMDP